MLRAWHRHGKLRCRRCRAVVYPSAVCIKRTWGPLWLALRLCVVPRATLCQPCKGES